MDQLEAIRTFVAVVQAGSFSAAAKLLDASQPTISKRIASLEAALSVSLLTRNSRGHTLSDAGAEYYKRCLRIIAELDEADAVVRGSSASPSGTLRITAPGILARLYITDIIAEFLREHPLISIDLVLTDQCIDLVGEGLDVAIRGGRLEDSSLTAVHLSANPRVIVATPGYLEERGTPEHPEDLTEHNCLLETAFRSGNLWVFHRDGSDVSVRVKGTFRCNEGDSIVSLLLDDHGIAVIPVWMAEPHLSEGRLRRVLSAYEPHAVPLQVVYPKAERVPMRVRSFVDFLRKRLRESRCFAD